MCFINKLLLFNYTVSNYLINTNFILAIGTNTTQLFFIRLLKE